MAEFQNVTVSFGERTVLDQFTHRLEKGSRTVLQGRSGIGKTTLLRVAAGLLKPQRGSFTHEGKVAVMFQEPRLLPHFSALGNIRAVLPSEADRTAIALEMLAAVGLAPEADKLPAALSGGMAQRLSCARFLAYARTTDADLLLLDEPFSALDEETAQKMAALLKAAAQNKTLLLVSHDPTVAQALEAETLTLA